MNTAIVFVREIFVKNSVAVSQPNVIIAFLAVAVDHLVPQSNVHAMLQHANVIRICVHNVAPMIFGMEMLTVTN